MLRAGLEALNSGDGSEARRHLSSFSYLGRPVEHARLHWLALALEMDADPTEARRTLARLRARGARLAARDDALLSLGTHYERDGYWSEAASVLAEIRATARTRQVERQAMERERLARLALGDPGALLALAREFAAKHPGDEHAAEALAIAASITGAESPLAALDSRSRLDRAWTIARSGDAAVALTELDATKPGAIPAGLRAEWSLARALALQRSGKHEESARAVAALGIGDGPLRLRALEIAAANAEAALAVVDAASWRTWVVREKTGTRRVRVKGRWTTKTLYRNVTRKARKTDKSSTKRLASARDASTVALERLLEAQEVAADRQKTLRALAALDRAAENYDAFETHVAALVALDPREDFGLQEIWNEGWAAWRARKLPLARERFSLIQRVYALPVARRQARYWYARCLERTGVPAEAKRIYDELVSVPRDDVYATFARTRGGTRVEAPPAIPPAPILGDAPPAELALAWELNKVGLGGEARTEVRAFQRDENRRWSYAILAESHARDGAQLLMANALRRGFPEIGTVDDDLVPERLRRMYYDSPHRGLLERVAERRELDPDLVMGLVLQESSGDASAGSRAGAMGLMQLMPATAEEVSRKAGLSFRQDRLTEAEFNVELGTRYLRELLTMMKGDEMLALASYNAGFGNVQRWLRAQRGAPPDEYLESIPFSETRGYVKRVLYYRSVYRQARSAG
ncbi:MAG: lytic transglycosylase domain-containing protein [Thermoanaerobaculia bacterium]